VAIPDVVTVEGVLCLFVMALLLLWLHLHLGLLLMLLDEWQIARMQFVKR
jgi:hypothetical protein